MHETIAEFPFESDSLMPSPHVHMYFLKQGLSPFPTETLSKECQTNRQQYNPDALSMLDNQKPKIKSMLVGYLQLEV